MPAFGGGGGGISALGGARFPDFTKKSMPIPAAAPPAPAAPEPPQPQAQLGPGQNLVAPKRGRGELKQQTAGMRVPLCGACGGQIRSGPEAEHDFVHAPGVILALGIFTLGQ